jgi:hypothetical protein
MCLQGNRLDPFSCSIEGRQSSLLPLASLQKILASITKGWHIPVQGTHQGGIEMIYLSANQSRLQWVGHEEVARREIKGTFKRFMYYCNGHKQYIYCRDQGVFLRLFAFWCSWAGTINNRVSGPPEVASVKYGYTLETIEGEDISLEDIIMDRPEGSPFRVKCLIQTQHGEYIQ